MKLRNKKTGEVKDFSVYGDIVWLGNYRYNSLAELNAEWEDYTPQEPRIKDEKVRNLVRDWASINNIKQLRVMVCDYVNYTIIKFCSPGYDSISIVYDGKGLENNKTYTVPELCGELEK